jgi:hypothetical protein
MAFIMDFGGFFYSKKEENIKTYMLGKALYST